MKEYRVFGPPGTGKTTYLSRQIKEACKTRGSDQIIVASFTRAAAHEIANKRVDGLKIPVPKENVGTLHSHCYRLLGSPDIADTKANEWNEEHPDFALSISGKTDMDDLDNERQSTTDGDVLFSNYQLLRAKMVEFQNMPASVRSFAKRWEGWKKEMGYIDFTDMIEMVYHDFDHFDGRPAIGFFDEVQDFVPLELALVRKMVKQMEQIVLAGDDDQAIYFFKGASPDAFLDPPLPEDHNRVLKQSYRVPKKVQAVAEKWIKQVRRRFEKEYRYREQAEGAVEVSGEITLKHPDFIVRHLEKELEGKNDLGNPKRVMILASCSYMLKDIIRVMRNEGIAFHNPYRTTNGAWNPLGKRRGTTVAERMLSFLATDYDIFGENAKDGFTHGDIQRFIHDLKSDTALLKGAKTRIKMDLQLKPAIENKSADLRRYFDEEVVKLFAMGDLDEKLNWFMANLLGSKVTRYEYPYKIIKSGDIEAFSRQPRIVVGTIHSVKGGEADTVYLFPDLSPRSMISWVNEGDGKDAIVRSFYVGMTRARNKLVLCSPASGRHVDTFRYF